MATDRVSKLKYCRQTDPSANAVGITPRRLEAIPNTQLFVNAAAQHYTKCLQPAMGKNNLLDRLSLSECPDFRELMTNPDHLSLINPESSLASQLRERSSLGM